MAGVLLFLGTCGYAVHATLDSEMDDLAQSGFRQSLPLHSHFVAVERDVVRRDTHTDESHSLAADRAPVSGRADASRLQHANEHMQLDNIAALGDARDIGNILTLRDLLDDPSVAVREEAVDALAEFDGMDAIAGLGYALSDPARSVRQLAIESLADLGSDEAIATLAWTLTDPDARLRMFAVEELSDIHNAMTVSLLQAFAGDTDRLVADVAAEILQDASHETRMQ